MFSCLPPLNHWKWRVNKLNESRVFWSIPLNELNAVKWILARRCKLSCVRLGPVNHVVSSRLAFHYTNTKIEGNQQNYRMCNRSVWFWTSNETRTSALLISVRNSVAVVHTLHPRRRDFRQWSSTSVKIDRIDSQNEWLWIISYSGDSESF